MFGLRSFPRSYQCGSRLIKYTLSWEEHWSEPPTKGDSRVTCSQLHSLAGRFWSTEYAPSIIYKIWVNVELSMERFIKNKTKLRMV